MHTRHVRRLVICESRGPERSPALVAPSRAFCQVGPVLGSLFHVKHRVSSDPMPACCESSVVARSPGTELMSADAAGRRSKIADAYGARGRPNRGHRKVACATPPGRAHCVHGWSGIALCVTRTHVNRADQVDDPSGGESNGRRWGRAWTRHGGPGRKPASRCSPGVNDADGLANRLGRATSPGRAGVPVGQAGHRRNCGGF
jgi:hypothetical protein